MYYCPWCYIHNPTGPGNPSPSEKINKQERPLELCPGCKIVWYCGDEHRQLDAARHGTDCKNRGNMVARIRREFTHLQLLCKPVLHFFRPLAANEPSYVLPATRPRTAPASSQSSKVCLSPSPASYMCVCRMTWTRAKRADSVCVIHSHPANLTIAFSKSL